MADRVVVLGGGLAGVACASTLGHEGVAVTVVDRNDYHQFQPLLYQVASSQLPAEDVARPHRAIFRHHATVEVMTVEVTEANLADRSLALADGRTLAGSHLVMAAGARPNFFGVPGAEEHAFPLYSVADADPDLARVAAEYGVALVCTHTGGVTPRTRPHRIEYADVVADAIASTVAQAERAVALGLDRRSVVIDPAHDFGKNTFHSLEITRRLGEMTATGWPVLVSLSNKDFVGETLDRPVGERLLGTLAATALCATAGARIFRVHEVSETRQVVDMALSIAGRRPPRRAVRGLA